MSSENLEMTECELTKMKVYDFMQCHKEMGNEEILIKY